MCKNEKCLGIKQAKHVFFIVKDANFSIHGWHCHHGYQRFLRLTTAQLGRISNILPIRGLGFWAGEDHILYTTVDEATVTPTVVNLRILKKLSLSGKMLSPPIMTMKESS